VGYAAFVGDAVCGDPTSGGCSDKDDGIQKQRLEYFGNQFIPKFNNVTIIGLLLTLIIFFSFQGDVILNNPLHIILIAIPLVLQTFLIFFIAYLASKWLKLPHNIAAPAGMIALPISSSLRWRLPFPCSARLLGCTGHHCGRAHRGAGQADSCKDRN
jgi:hypothetical protein